MSLQPPSAHIIHDDVARALAEDIGSGDITAELIPVENVAWATIITREPAIVCGIDWATETFRQIDSGIKLEWKVKDGQTVVEDQILCQLHGSARNLLSAERTALNFLQTLSGTASTAHQYAHAVRQFNTIILDTRKTLPGLRHAQKYAVRCGGAQNHRLGLYDAFLIKENHIMAYGSIGAAIAQARRNHCDRPVEIEVETLEELEQALIANADIVMLDNFSLEQMRAAVASTAGRARLEASGNIHMNNLVETAETGVDYISIGSITKHLRAIDLSMRFRK